MYIICFNNLIKYIHKYLEYNNISVKFIIRIIIIFVFICIFEFEIYSYSLFVFFSKFDIKKVPNSEPVKGFKNVN